MMVSREGEIRWKVPDDFAEDKAQVILVVRNAGGEEIFHSFDLAVN